MSRRSCEKEGILRENCNMQLVIEAASFLVITSISRSASWILYPQKLPKQLNRKSLVEG